MESKVRYFIRIIIEEYPKNTPNLHSESLHGSKNVVKRDTFTINNNNNNNKIT